MVQGSTRQLLSHRRRHVVKRFRERDPDRQSHGLWIRWRGSGTADLLLHKSNRQDPGMKPSEVLLQGGPCRRMAAREAQRLQNHVEARTSGKEADMGATLVSVEFESGPCLALLLLVKPKGRRHTGENAVRFGIRRCGKWIR